MTKTYRLEGLDCPVCAAKMESGIKKIKGVEDVAVSFITQKLTLSAPDDIFEKVFKDAVKACKRVEPDLIIE